MIIMIQIPNNIFFLQIVILSHNISSTEKPIIIMITTQMKKHTLQINNCSASMSNIQNNTANFMKAIKN